MCSKNVKNNELWKRQFYKTCITLVNLKFALVSRKDSEGCYDFVELNGYIVEMIYNEHGAFIKSRTFFIDKF